MRASAVAILCDMLGAADPGLRAGALVLLGLVAKEAAAATTAAAASRTGRGVHNAEHATVDVPGTVRSSSATAMASPRGDGSRGVYDGDGLPWLAQRLRPWERRRARGGGGGGDSGDDEEDALFGRVFEVDGGGGAPVGLSSSAARDAVQDAMAGGEFSVIHRMRVTDPNLQSLSLNPTNQILKNP
jgi:hypothetical protein